MKKVCLTLAIFIVILLLIYRIGSGDTKLPAIGLPLENQSTSGQTSNQGNGNSATVGMPNPNLEIVLVSNNIVTLTSEHVIIDLHDEFGKVFGPMLQAEDPNDHFYLRDPDGHIPKTVYLGAGGDGNKFSLNTPEGKLVRRLEVWADVPTRLQIQLYGYR